MQLDASREDNNSGNVTTSPPLQRARAEEQPLGTNLDADKGGWAGLNRNVVLDSLVQGVTYEGASSLRFCHKQSFFYCLVLKSKF
jgi:hypothetical protein